MSINPNEQALQLLRAAAEAQLANTASPEMTAHSAAELLHELRVRLINLEKQNEDLQQQNEADHKLLLDSVVEGIYGVDMQGNCTFINPSALRLLGYQQEAELLGKQMHEIIHHTRVDGSHYPAAESRLYRCLHSYENIHVDDELFWRKDGSSLFVDYWSRPINRDDQVVGAVITFFDITERKLGEEKLKLNKIIIDTTGEGFWLVDLTGHILEVNQAYAKMIGYTREELVGMHISNISLTSDQPDLVMANIQKIISQGYLNFETRHRHKDGHIIDLEASITHIEKSKCLFSFLRDITERKRAEEELRIAAATFETHEAILITDANANIIRVNRAFQDITGFSSEDVLGKNPRILSSGNQDKTFYAEMWRQLLNHGAWAGEMWDRHKDGHIYPKYLTITAVKNEAGKTTQYVAIFSDITVRKQAEEEIHNLAFYDALTKLPNRRLLMDRLLQALAVSARIEQHGAVMFLDMDHFKTLNDTRGHDVGDMLLIEVAKRLQSCVRDVDTVARLGGDEFIVLLETLGKTAIEADAAAGLVAEKIRAALNQPYQFHEYKYHTTASIGVSMFYGNRQSVDELLKCADQAMYQDKLARRDASRG